jgi:survival-of-motor-neuron-related-splicing factor 30
MTETLHEYQAQLDDVINLLQESPNDESLLSLKADLEELIAITQQSAGDETAEDETTRGGTASVQQQPLSVAAAIDAATNLALASARGETEDYHYHDDDHDNKRNIDQISAPEAQAPAKKAAKKTVVDKEFVVPSGLVVLETDTDAEKNRKYRAIKSLKTKWRAKNKELQSDQKQKSWQSFQKKKKSIVKEKSMFATSEGDTKVGVVSAGNRLTQGGERKRHKY